MSIDSRFHAPGPAGSATLLVPAAPSPQGDEDGFADMKRLFAQAAANLAHRKAAWLRTQVQAAEDSADLWLLRGPLLAALRADDRATRALRGAIYKSLDHAFPHAFATPLAPPSLAARAAG